MCSNSYLNHYIKVGQHPKCVISSIERAGQPLVKQAVSSAEICIQQFIIKSIALASAYEVFATETQKSHLAADTKSTIINSTQRFILSVSEDGLADWCLLDMSYIDLFLSKYKDNQLKYRGTLIYGLKHSWRTSSKTQHSSQIFMPAVE